MTLFSMLVRPDGERRAAMVSPHQLLKESFCGGNATSSAEHEFDGIARRIDSAVQTSKRKGGKCLPALPLSSHAPYPAGYGVTRKMPQMPPSNWKDWNVR
jgi:hypothetical protein